MIARRAVWSDEKVRALLARFVPAADEVGFLQRTEGPEGVLFRKVAEQGHYAGRTQPTSTRQGIYATTVDGRLLASINHNDLARMVAMLEKAWAAWEAIPAAERVPPGGWDGKEGLRRLEDRYPVGGLVLRVTSRDLPRAKPPKEDWRAKAWNLDYLWFRADEAAALVPDPPSPGAERPWPRALADRLVRLALLDNVRGQSPPAEASAVDWERTRVVSRVVAVEDGRVRLAVEGTGRWEARGRWRVEGEREPSERARGFEGTLLGSGTWDPKAKRFTALELLAAGLRWGATQYNVRQDDPGPAPIGYLLELAGDSSAERVAPATIWEYGWR